MATLYRPVGLHELALIWDLGLRAFPPRLPHQPIFYPVLELEYARQIASNWNVGDEASGFSGFVTRFDIDDFFLSDFEPRIVGTRKHAEYWIPAEQMSAFNAAMEGVVAIEEAFFGVKFQGEIPECYGLKGKNAVAQFACLAKTLEYSSMDFVCEIAANSKAVFLNSLFWAQYDFSEMGVTEEQKYQVLRQVQKAWEFNGTKISLPNAFTTKL